MLAAIDKLARARARRTDRLQAVRADRKKPLATRAWAPSARRRRRGRHVLQGMENLRGKGIGRFVAGNIARAASPGTVIHATSTTSAPRHHLQGSVGYVINTTSTRSPPHERGAAEDARPGRQDRLEWGISIAGAVTASRTKSSTIIAGRRIVHLDCAEAVGSSPPRPRERASSCSYPFMFTRSPSKCFPLRVEFQLSSGTRCHITGGCSDFLVFARRSEPAKKFVSRQWSGP